MTNPNDEASGTATNATNDNLAGTADLRALANSVRLDMLRLLRDREWTMADLATELGLRKGSVSYHLRVLERAAIVRQSGERSVRGGRQQLWALSAASIAGDPAITTPSSRPAVLRALASQMESRAAQRLFVSSVRLDAAATEKAIILLEGALESIRELETDAGDVVTLGAFTFSSAAG
ncbi:transcriptional regulator [Salinibacterium sp. M195]|uniref:ArsR/SmtB family transcription factor n=1 Tax=Salinibacterium sp. M195 TaxID=2583374 RepID=UPI001C6375C8|nr:winged helix-turn-helix domain-containing protein [Salinibacterium sp. M195]QYH36371.1 winged helix-turn-helix transcriptional regulator [Salinibacterium sp. M195]